MSEEHQGMNISSIEEPPQEVPSILLTEYGIPEFLGEGMLATDGNTYFHTIESEGKPINVNDSVLVLTLEKQDIRKDFTYCGKILKFWETVNGLRLAKINWYVRREEAPEESKNFLLRRELLLTEKTDVIDVDSIKMKITVHQSPEPLGKNANVPPETLTNEFFCNRGYLISKHEFVALSTIIRMMKIADYTVENVEGTSKYDLAKAKLQLNFVPQVAGRQQEMEKMFNTLQSFLLQKGRGACLYVSGVPGTGKTLCVREVIRQLTQDQMNGDVSDFDFYEVNCLRLESPKDIFVDMWCQMAGEKLNAAAAQKALNDVFSYDPPHNYIILLVDEVDVLLTNQQNEFYCLLEWCGLAKSNFIVVCIANLMDLDARLKPKLQSRLGKSAVKFYPYKYEELKDIIESRVGDLNVFSPSAIERCCKRIANIGGDARKALEACKRSLECLKSKKVEKSDNDQKDDKNIVEEKEPIVELMDMERALSELQQTRALQLLDSLSSSQQIFMTALLQDMKITSRSIVPLRDILQRHRTIQTQMKVKFPLKKQMMITVANELIEMKIIKGIKERNVTANSQIALQCMEFDVKIALTKVKALNKYLPE